MSIVAHLDMDSFFASIEERANPQFAGWGIVVGADPKYGTGRGVVSTANYQARKYGIHSAQPISEAWRLSQQALKRGEPKTVFLPVNGRYYSQVSERIMKTIATLLHGYMVAKFSDQQLNNETIKQFPPVEQTSIDEVYIDLSFCLSDAPSRNFITNASDRLHLLPKGLDGGYQKALELMKRIKKEIKDKEKLTATVGIGPNKLIAKMVSARFKPDGLAVIKPGEVEKFLDPLPIGDIPGIGSKTEEFFHQKNIYKVADLKKVSRQQLIGWLGKWGEDIWEKARGIDDSEVTPEREIKSISEQETFDKDTLSAAFILDRLYRLAARVIGRMQVEGISGFKTVTIVVRFADFTTKNRAHSLKSYSDNLKILNTEAIKLLLPFLDRRGNPKLQKIRLIGVGIEHFEGEKEDLKEKKIIEQTKLFNT